MKFQKENNQDQVPQVDIWDKIELVVKDMIVEVVIEDLIEEVEVLIEEEVEIQEGEVVEEVME